MSHIRTIGLILAAGRSSRLGDAKALLPLENSNIIGTAVNKLLKYCTEVMIVTGRDAELVKVYFADNPRVKTVNNDDYETSPMFTSVVLGLKQIMDKGERFFLLPCDTPAFRENTLKIMLNYMGVTAATVVKPMFNGISGHPILIDMSLSKKIFESDCEKGLGGILEKTEGVKRVPVADYGILLDTDTPQDYEILKSYYRNKEIPTHDECEAILDLNHVPDNIRAHCKAVAVKAVEVAGQLEKSGHKLNRELIYAGALLHDICRTQGNHALQGAQLLSKMGFDKTAKIVSEHMDISHPDVLDECAVVYYADKITTDDKYISLDERWKQIEKKLNGNDEALLNSGKRIQSARLIEKTIEKEISRLI